MEELLGVKKESITRISDALGEDTVAADSQADESGNDAARTRYQRMFWEPTPENAVSCLSTSSSPNIKRPLPSRRLFPRFWRQYVNEVRNGMPLPSQYRFACLNGKAVPIFTSSTLATNLWIRRQNRNGCDRPNGGLHCEQGDKHAALRTAPLSQPR